MLPALQAVLAVQDVDMKLLRLLRLKRERQKELEQLQGIKTDLTTQVEARRTENLETKKDIRLAEIQLEELKERLKKLEDQQASVKRVEEFNALTQEMSGISRERHAVELRLAELGDRLVVQEEALATAETNLKSTNESSATIEEEIGETIKRINEEGLVLAEERRKLAKAVPADILEIYERLFRNRQDRVVVPIENRTCSGCHIVVTAQHENLVRKGERLIFCEHCSRIHYWQEPAAEAVEEGAAPAKRRRRRLATAA
jgi:predicted  nucleic acid-binding Zn-ribbon protein